MVPLEKSIDNRITRRNMTTYFTNARPQHKIKVLLFILALTSISFTLKMHVTVILNSESVLSTYSLNDDIEFLSKVNESEVDQRIETRFYNRQINQTISFENLTSAVNATTIESIDKNNSTNKFAEILPVYRSAYEKYQNIRTTPMNYEQYIFMNTTSISLSTYGDHILKGGCNLTVQIMDPRISTLHPGGPAFFALESVATFLPKACVVITTSKCKVKWKNSDETKMAVEDVIHQHIYNSSLPLFQKMIERGHVRVKYLDHSMYQLKSCDNFYSPSSAMMNINYWGSDQFIDGVDSDTVLIIQDDSALCNTPNIEYLRQFPFIGGLWTKFECKWVEQLWRRFTLPLQSFRDMEGKGLLSEQDKILNLANISELMYPYCQKESGIGPIGNGGFSLRSRKAMIKVIETCPHVKFSGISMTNRTFPCETQENIPEDIYFATGLRGLRAKMPSAYEAALFSVERVWPIESTQMFGGPTTKLEQLNSAKNVINSNLSFVQVKDRMEIIPIGFHQLNVFHQKNFFMEGTIWEECPFVSFIYDPLDKRNHKPKSTS